jgi:hypothetical protein
MRRKNDSELSYPPPGLYYVDSGELPGSAVYRSV